MAISHHQKVPVLIAGVLVQNLPVRYLGVMVGSGDLTKQNFAYILEKAYLVTKQWSKRTLSLPAKVLVSKTFIFSTFVHICNCSLFTNDQIKTIQSILNDFIWNKRNKINQSVMCSPVLDGGLNMVHVKNVIHAMRVKWLNRLCLDRGQSWLRMAWSQITKYILDTLLLVLTGVCESDIQKIPPFYAAVLHSYCHANSLFY